MRTAAILPIKRFTQAKQRLGASVADPLRLELARAMVGDVLAALAETASIERTIVVTSEPSAADTARAQGAIVIDDTAQHGQSAAVTLGVERALAEGIERALCIPGDCPTLDPAELEALLSAPASGQPEVVIIPDRHGTGTNGLLLAPPEIIPPASALTAVSVTASSRTPLESSIASSGRPRCSWTSTPARTSPRYASDFPQSISEPPAPERCSTQHERRGKPYRPRLSAASRRCAPGTTSRS